jgi:hypothetical protein
MKPGTIHRKLEQAATIAKAAKVGAESRNVQGAPVPVAAPHPDLTLGRQ